MIDLDDAKTKKRLRPKRIVGWEPEGGGKRRDTTLGGVGSRGAMRKGCRLLEGGSVVIHDTLSVTCTLWYVIK